MTPKLSSKAERLLERMEIRARLSKGRKPAPAVRAEETPAKVSDTLMPPDELERLLKGKTLGRR